MLIMHTMRLLCLALLCVALHSEAHAAPAINATWTRKVSDAWKPGTRFLAHVVADERLVYFHDQQSNNTLFALSPESGAVVWNTSLSPYFYSDGRIDVRMGYVAMVNRMSDSVYLVSSNGTALWKVSPPHTGRGCFMIGPRVTPFGVLVTFSPCLSAGVIAETMMLSLQNGSVLWRKPIGFELDFFQTLQISETAFYIITNTTDTFPGKVGVGAFRLADGSQIYMKEYNSSFKTFIDEMVYDPMTQYLLTMIHNNQGSFLLTFDARDGSLVRNAEVGYATFMFCPFISLVHDDNRSYVVMTSAELHGRTMLVSKLDVLTGKQLWSVSLSAPTDAFIEVVGAVASPTTVVVGGAGNVYGIGMQNGDVRWVSPYFSNTGWYRFVKSSDRVAVGLLALTNSSEAKIAAYRF